MFDALTYSQNVEKLLICIKEQIECKLLYYAFQNCCDLPNFVSLKQLLQAQYGNLN